MASILMIITITIASITHINTVLFNSTAATAMSGAAYGQGDGPIVMNNVICDGDEARVMDCSLSVNHTCAHGNDASVRCIISETG